MRITYNPVARAAYVYLKGTQVVAGQSITDGVTVDFDDDGEVVGVEILGVDEPAVEVTTNTP